MKKITQAIFLFLFIGFSATAQLANWSPGSNAAYTNFPVNVSGQINGFCRISQIRFHPSNQNKLYAVTGEGGFFISNDEGANWTVKAGTENLTGSCASICIDYTNDQVIYLGSGDANYYSNGQGIYKSTDGGATFNATSLTNCLVLEILQDPSNAATFVAATNKGIYKSTNNGATWVATTATTIQFCDLKQNATVNSTILYACTRENSAKFYRSTDFGSTWTQITSGITTAVNFIQAGGRIGVTPADPNVVYFEAIGGGGIIHKSNDGGLTFNIKRAEGTGTIALPYLTFYDYDNNNGLTGQGNYNNAICVDVADPSKLWIQAHNTWLSTDSGTTWTQLTYWASKVHTDMHQIQQSPFDASKLYSCNDGGVWLSTDGGNNWTPKSNGLYAYEVYNNCGKSSNTNRNYIALGTQDNGRVYRNAVGWFTDRGGDDGRQKEFDYLPNGGYYYEKSQVNRKSASNGATSSAGFTTSGNYWEYLAFNRTNTDLGFMWFTNNNLYRSVNLSAAAPTWDSVFTFSAPVTAMHSCIADANQLYVITNNTKIQVSSNALSATPTFTTYNLPTASNSLASIAAIANNANTVYISINNRVYVSTDAGATWTNITYNLPSVNHRKILAEEIGGVQELVFIATNNAVYYKKAGQTTWTNYSTNLPGRRAPTNFTMYDDGTGLSLLRYYTYGRAVMETPFGNLRSLSSSFDVTQKLYCSTGSNVQFTDFSTGNVTSWSWSFPGGTPATSNAQNPVVTYSSPGLYGATLTVNDGFTTNTFSKTNLFLVMASSPTANTGCSIAPNSNLNNGFGIGIRSFNLENINNISSSSDGAYNDYSCTQWTTLTQGSTYNATISTGTANAEGARLYIDINNNGIFETTEALVTYPNNNSGTRTLSFTVPTSGVTLNTGLRLRVVSRFNSIPSNACNVSTYGQAEDYTVFILPIPSSILSNGSGSSTICTGQSANLKVDIVSGTSPYTITVSDGSNNQTVNNYSSGSDIPVSPITNTTYSLVTVFDIFGTSIPVSGSASVTLNSYDITASAGANGSITPNGITSVNCGASQSFTITPNSGFNIQDVLVDGVSQGSITNYTFNNVTLAHSISVTFASGSNTITANAGANGSISPVGTTTISSGGSQTYTIIPQACFQVSDVLVDGVSIGAVTTYTFSNVTINHTIQALFSLDPVQQSVAATSILTNASYNNICTGNNVNLTVNGGLLGTGAMWKWYSGTCGGALEGVGPSITISPTVTNNYFVRAEGICGNSNCVNTTITVSSVAPDSANVLLPFSGMPINVCSGTSANLSIPAIGGTAYYVWDVPSGGYFNGNPLNTSPFTTTTSSVLVTYGAPLSSLYTTGVQAGNACGNSIRKTQKTRGSTSVPALITGPLTSCANSTVTYSTPPITGAISYLWTITGDASVTGTASSINVTFGPAWNGGTLCVAAQTTCYTSPAKYINISSSAAPLTNIIGSFTACPNTMQTYSVAASASASSYNWTLPIGATGNSSTNNINVTYGAGYNAVSNICVSVTSICGITSIPKCKTVAPGLPNMPSAIIGASNGLCNQTLLYSCPNQGSGVTYNWSAPTGATITGNGTNNVGVAFGTFTTGSLCVSAINTCGNSSSRCIAIKGAPNAPTTLTASPATWCANDIGIQFTANTINLTGAYSLSWLYPLPPIATYSAGGGNSNSLTLDWGTGNGNIVVIAQNACGSASKLLAANVNCRQGVDQSGESQFTVYPNPVSGTLNILYLGKKENTKIEVFDIAGRLVHSQNKESVDGNNLISIDMSKTAKGIYLLKIIGKHGYYQKRIVVE